MDAISYLRGFFDGEGNAQCRLGKSARAQRQVSAASTSPELIELVVALLQTLGFSPHIHRIEHHRRGWRPIQIISLTGRRDLIRFARLIGFRKAENAERLHAIRRSYWRSRRRYRFYGLTSRIQQMRRDGVSLREIARRVGAPDKSTIQMLLRRVASA